MILILEQMKHSNFKQKTVHCILRKEERKIKAKWKETKKFNKTLIHVVLCGGYKVIKAKKKHHCEVQIKWSKTTIISKHNAHRTHNDNSVKGKIKSFTEIAKKWNEKRKNVWKR